MELSLPPWISEINGFHDWAFLERKQKCETSGQITEYIGVVAV